MRFSHGRRTTPRRSVCAPGNGRLIEFADRYSYERRFLMEPRHEKGKDKELRIEAKEAKPRRFRLVRLEERIAPFHPRSYFHVCTNGCQLTHHC